MKMPKTVRIGSQVWEIHEESRKTAYDDEVYGFCKNKESAIVVDAGLPLSLKRVTLLHELLHAIRFTYGGSFAPNKSTSYNEWEHYFIGLYEEPVLSMLRDNPELAAFLLEP